MLRKHTTWYLKQKKKLDQTIKLKINDQQLNLFLKFRKAPQKFFC